jgi:copper homeostasis protein
MLIEVCANSFTSAVQALKGGAQRVELCQNLESGGTTPSAATIQLAVERLKKEGLAIFVLIRPRAGSFCYTDLEFEVMKRDILFCKKYNVDGIVIGLLTSEYKIDLVKTAALVELAQPMQVTFHRAFDFVSEPFEAFEQIIDFGIQRILTSGQQSTAIKGKILIRQLIEKANDRIIVMPGSGVNSGNIHNLAEITNAKEFHLSAKKLIRDLEKTNVVENLENEYFLTDSEEVKKVVAALKKW